MFSDTSTMAVYRSVYNSTMPSEHQTARVISDLSTGMSLYEVACRHVLTLTTVDRIARAARLPRELVHKSVPGYACHLSEHDVKSIASLERYQSHFVANKSPQHIQNTLLHMRGKFVTRRSGDGTMVWRLW